MTIKDLIINLLDTEFLIRNNFDELRDESRKAVLKAVQILMELPPDVRVEDYLCTIKEIRKAYELGN